MCGVCVVRVYVRMFVCVHACVCVCFCECVRVCVLARERALHYFLAPNDPTSTWWVLDTSVAAHTCVSIQRD